MVEEKSVSNMHEHNLYLCAKELEECAKLNEEIMSMEKEYAGDGLKEYEET